MDIYQYFFNHSSEIMCTVGADDIFLQVNQQFLKTLGIEENDIVGKHVSNFIHPDDLKSTLAKIDDINNGNPTKDFQNRYRKADGTYLYIEWSSVYNHEDGYRYAIGRDVTQKIELQQLLKRTESSAQIGGWEYIVKTQEITWTDQLYELYGINKNDPNSVEIGIKQYHEADQPIISKAFEACLQGVPYELKCRFVRANGEVIWVKTNGNPIYNSNGEIYKLRGFFQNIDKEEKTRLDNIKSKESLAKRNIELQALFETFPDLLFWMDKDGKYLDFISGIQKPLIPPEVFLGKHIADMMPPDVAQHQMKLIHQCIEQKEVMYDEYSMDYEDGKKFFESRYLPLGKDEVLVVVRDIGELIESRKMLENTISDLRRSNIDLEQFAYVISHDLQEPLRMIGSFSQLLQLKLKDKLNNEEVTYMKYILDSAIRMKGLINGLLQYSRVGLKEVEFRKTDIKALIESKLEDLRLLFLEKNAQVEFGTLPKAMICNPEQLGIVLYNLINNGIKFNNAEIPRVSIQYQEEKDYHLFCISDNGIGIDKRFKDKIFLVFQQLHDGKSYGGTGIGLALCKKIVEHHKGEIWFDQALNGGTVFKFRINKQLK